MGVHVLYFIIIIYFYIFPSWFVWLFLLIVFCLSLLLVSLVNLFIPTSPFPFFSFSPTSSYRFPPPLLPLPNKISQKKKKKTQNHRYKSLEHNTEGASEPTAFGSALPRPIIKSDSEPTTRSICSLFCYFFLSGEPNDLTHRTGTPRLNPVTRDFFFPLSGRVTGVRSMSSTRYK